MHISPNIISKDQSHIYEDIKRRVKFGERLRPSLLKKLAVAQPINRSGLWYGEWPLQRINVRCVTKFEEILPFMKEQRDSESLTLSYKDLFCRGERKKKLYKRSGRINKAIGGVSRASHSPYSHSLKRLAMKFKTFWNGRIFTSVFATKLLKY